MIRNSTKISQPRGGCAQKVRDSIGKEIRCIDLQRDDVGDGYGGLAFKVGWHRIRTAHGGGLLKKNQVLADFSGPLRSEGEGRINHGWEKGNK